jgi:ABC-2 type transport system ATP-binding protein
VLTAEGLTKRFAGQPTPAVNGLDLEVRNGEIVGFVGLNGAGKTTTLRIAAGVALPTKGRVRIDGLDIVREKRRAAQRLGWVPELFPFEPQMRAGALLRYFAGFHGLSGASASARAHELLVQVGLGEFENRPLRTFSQGMKRRFSLTSAMIADPANLLLVEVLNGLDPAGIAFVRSWGIAMRGEGRSVLLSSHILSELETLADRVAIVHRGRILQVITRAQLAEVGGHTLRIVVDRIDEALLQYLAGVGEPVVEGPSIRLNAPNVDSATINAELVQRGYRVSSLSVEGRSLESFFLEIVRGAT